MSDDSLWASGGNPRRVFVERTYRVSPETAFDAWINPDSLTRWFGPPGFTARILTHDPRVGGTWRFNMRSVEGESYHHFGQFVEVTPPRKLVFTWASEEQVEGWRDEKNAPTVVTVEFTPCPEGTKVTVTHEKLISDMARDALTRGWGGGLECLEDFFADQSA
ncbi:SRPBCC family protein [Denitrobaculum tricleocarpae]|uniref:SRPBCC domain-containing protein n=1 Tax=Denitrobaculum tricleocarpae TaxID=2591009 RepID=A0A545T0A3_9PROT|nr:SRPBCC domain-containing protein [Denitrobaculum tricleocarpae]TQV70642.1 SRPBCC domain-containing protein [Denitrobaculum tricleocarpae]